MGILAARIAHVDTRFWTAKPFAEIQYRSAVSTSLEGTRIVRFWRWTSSAVRRTMSRPSSRYSQISPCSQAYRRGSRPSGCSARVRYLRKERSKMMSCCQYGTPRACLPNLGVVGVDG